MNTQAASLRVRISADLVDIKQGLGLLRGELAKVKADASKSVPDSSKWTNSLKGVRRQIGTLVAAYASLRTIKVFAALSDEATQLRGRLQAAGADYKALFQLAQDTRTGLSSTADLYTRLERSTRSHGLNQERLLNVTKAVNQAIKLSYADAGAADAAIVQLGQGLSAGALRGDELNSVMEQTPRLAEAIATGMGVTIGQLRDLGKQGRLTGAEVIKALENQADVLEKEYQAVPVTISDAIVQVKNAFLDFVGNQNEATGAAQRFAKVLQDVASGLPAFFNPVIEVFAALAASLNDVSGSAGQAGESLSDTEKRASWMAKTGEALAAVLRWVAAAGILLKNAVEIVTTVLMALGTMAASVSNILIGSLGRAFDGISASWVALKDRGPVAAMQEFSSAVGDVKGNLSGLSSSLESQMAAAREIIAENRRDIAEGWGNLFLEDFSSPGKSGSSSGGGVGRGSSDGGGGGAAKRIAESNALLRDAIDRALKELDRLYQEGEIGLRDYFATKEQLQQQAIDAEIAQARADLAVTKDLGQRRRLEEQIIKLQRDRAEIGINAAREQAKAEKELADQLDQVKLRLLELDGETAQAEMMRLEAQYADMLKRLRTNSDDAGEALVQSLIGRLSNRAQLDQLKDSASKITSSLQGTETSVSAQVGSGMLGYTEGERRLYEVRKQSLQQLIELRQAAADYLATLSDSSQEGIEARDFLQSLNTDIANVIASQQAFKQEIVDQGSSALGSFFSDLIDGSKSFKDAFADMVRSFAAGIAQMIAQSLALRAMQSMLGIGGVTAGVAHVGGVAGTLGSIRRNVSPLLFGAAPRYHGGGIAGLAPDEVPAILQRGERVLSRRQTAEYDASQRGGIVTTPVVAIGDDAVANALAGSAGERVVMTHVRNNWGGLTRGAG